MKPFILEKARLDSSFGVMVVEELKKKYLYLIKIAGRIMEKAIRKGEIREMHPHDLACALIAILNCFVLSWLAFPKQSDILSKGSFIYDIFLNGTIKKPARGKKLKP